MLISLVPNTEATYMLDFELPRGLTVYQFDTPLPDASLSLPLHAGLQGLNAEIQFDGKQMAKRPLYTKLGATSYSPPNHFRAIMPAAFRDFAAVCTRNHLDFSNLLACDASMWITTITKSLNVNGALSEVRITLEDDEFHTFTFGQLDDFGRVAPGTVGAHIDALIHTLTEEYYSINLEYGYDVTLYETVPELVVVGGEASEMLQSVQEEDPELYHRFRTLQARTKSMLINLFRRFVLPCLRDNLPGNYLLWSAAKAMHENRESAVEVAGKLASLLLPLSDESWSTDMLEWIATALTNSYSLQSALDGQDPNYNPPGPVPLPTLDFAILCDIEVTIWKAIKARQKSLLIAKQKEENLKAAIERFDEEHQQSLKSDSLKREATEFSTLALEVDRPAKRSKRSPLASEPISKTAATPKRPKLSRSNAACPSSFTAADEIEELSDHNDSLDRKPRRDSTFIAPTQSGASKPQKPVKKPRSRPTTPIVKEFKFGGEVVKAKRDREVVDVLDRVPEDASLRFHADATIVDLDPFVFVPDTPPQSSVPLATIAFNRPILHVFNEPSDLFSPPSAASSNTKEGLQRSNAMTQLFILHSAFNSTSTNPITHSIKPTGLLPSPMVIPSTTSSEEFGPDTPPRRLLAENRRLKRPRPVDLEELPKRSPLDWLLPNTPTGKSTEPNFVSPPKTFGYINNISDDSGGSSDTTEPDVFGSEDRGLPV